MPKAATRKKTLAESASRARHARQKEKHDGSEQRDEDEDGLFLSKSSPPPARAPRRLNANKPARVQPANSKMDEGDRASNRNIDKNERVQGRTAAGRKSNKLLDDFENLVDHRNNVSEKEIKDILVRRVTSEESFLNKFHTTFFSITNDGLTTSKSGEACHLLRYTTKAVLSKAHDLLQESQSGMFKLSSNNTSATLMETEENWALNFQHTERILEVGRLVGEDKINAKLSGLVPIVHDPDYSDTSAALFATDEGDREVETWAKAARNQGRVVKKMTAAIAEY